MELSEGTPLIVAIRAGDDWRTVDLGLKGHVIDGDLVIPFSNLESAIDCWRIGLNTLRRETENTDDSHSAI